jgi:hypothetical protein
MGAAGLTELEEEQGQSLVWVLRGTNLMPHLSSGLLEHWCPLEFPSQKCGIEWIEVFLKVLVALCPTR